MESSVLSEEQFARFVEICLKVLDKYQLTVQDSYKLSWPRSLLCFSQIKNAFNEFVDSSPSRRLPSTTPVTITGEQLDRMTLDCVVAVARELPLPGINALPYKECLSMFRYNLEDLIRHIGYKITIDSTNKGVGSHWLCYRLWEDIARLSGWSEETIVEWRAFYKKEAPKHGLMYES